MKKKVAALVFGGIFATSFVVTPAFALALACPGDSVPVVDSISTDYNAHTGVTEKIVIYHCV